LVKEVKARRAEEAKRAAKAPLPEYNTVNPAFYTAPVGSEMAPEEEEQDDLERERIDVMNADSRDTAIARRRMAEQGFEMSPEEQEQDNLDRERIDVMNADSRDAAIARRRMAEQGFESEDDYDERYRRAQKGVEAPLRTTAFEFQNKYEADKSDERVNKANADADKVLQEQKKDKEAEAKQEKDKYDFDLQRQRALFAARASNLSADLRKRAEKAQEDAILEQGGPELLAAWKKDKKSKEEGEKLMAKINEQSEIQRKKQEEAEKRQIRADQIVALREREQLKARMEEAAKDLAIKRENHKLTRDILDVSTRLANDQILRLKMLVVSNSTAVDLAQQLTIQGDRLEQEIRDSRSEFKFNIAQRGGANGDDFKIQNDVDYYKEELEKTKMCIMDFKKKAIDQYNLDLAKLDQQKEELKTKAFEVKIQQENNKDNKSKDLSTWSVDDLNKKMKEVENQITGLKKDKKDTTSADKYLQRLKDALKSKKTGGNRRVTIRQPPRPKHRVY
jgi:hypothetical protein